MKAKKNDKTPDKGIEDMTLVELLNHYEGSIDDDGIVSDDHNETIEEIMSRWPLDRIGELQEEVNDLRSEMGRLKSHYHLADGTTVVKI